MRLNNLNYPGQDAIKAKGWLLAHRWLILRRMSQLSVLGIFLLGPVFSIWIIKGNMSASLILDVLPLTDPFVFLQTLFSRHLVELNLVFGALLVSLFYLIVGGRVYCSWVCPINIVTDLADWLRRSLYIKTQLSFSRYTRYAFLVAIMLLAFSSGILIWELFNPVTMLQRELIFTMGVSGVLVTAIFILDAFVSRRAWCGHLCPMGAFYSLLGRYSLLKVNTLNRENCNDCMDCYVVCPEPQVIKPALKGKHDSSILIHSGLCTNCGRCIDVCAKDVFSIKHRFINSNSIASQNEVRL